MKKLERKFNLSGAYDERDPPRNYGIGSMRMEFAVVGPKGAVSVQLSTSWYLPQVQQSTLDMYTKGYPFDACEELMQPKWWDVGYHAKEPQYEGQSEREDCHLLDCPCYYDGTSLWGQEAWLPGFLHGGSDWLWERLEEYYYHRYEDGPAPNLTPVPRTFK